MPILPPARVRLGALCAALLAASLVTAGAAEPAQAAKHAPRCAGDGATIAESKQVDWSALPSAATFTTRVAAADGRIVDLGRRTVGLTDFRRTDLTYDGGRISAGGLIGRGMGPTTLQLKPHSSTKAWTIPTAYPHTNPLDVLRVDGTATVLRGFTVRGTAQGHLYNGLRVSRVKNLRASHIRVLHIPGRTYNPPGETFGINDYRTTGSRWSHIRINGQRVSSSGFATNGSRNVRLCDVVSRNNRGGMGFAFWQTRTIRLVDCKAFRNGFAGFNLERVSGTVTVIRPDASGNRYDFRVATDRTSARIRIVDPVLHGGVFTVSMPRHWNGTNRQRTSDITLVIGGKTRNDLLRFHRY